MFHPCIIPTMEEGCSSKAICIPANVPKFKKFNNWHKKYSKRNSKTHWNVDITLLKIKKKQTQWSVLGKYIGILQQARGQVQPESQKCYIPLSSIKKLVSLWGAETGCMVNCHLEKIVADWGFKHEFNMSFPLITLKTSADVSGRY